MQWKLCPRYWDIIPCYLSPPVSQRFIQLISCFLYIAISLQKYNIITLAKNKKKSLCFKGLNVEDEVWGFFFIYSGNSAVQNIYHIFFINKEPLSFFYLLPLPITVLEWDTYCLGSHLKNQKNQVNICHERNAGGSEKCWFYN